MGYAKTEHSKKLRNATSAAAKQKKKKLGWQLFSIELSPEAWAVLAQEMARTGEKRGGVINRVLIELGKNNHQED